MSTLGSLDSVVREIVCESFVEKYGCGKMSHRPVMNHRHAEYTDRSLAGTSN